MKMPQRHIVEIFEHLRVHIVRAAYGDLLRLAGSRAGDELVCQQYVPSRLIHFHVLYRCANGIGIAFDTLIGIKTLYMDGLYKRQ